MGTHCTVLEILKIVQADVPNDALFQQPNLDLRGPARYLYLQDLVGVQPKPLGR